MKLTKSEPQQLGKNDAANGPHPYRTKPKLGAPEEIGFELYEQVVKSEEHGFFGTRTGRSE